ncbi:MAG: hypothetical protein KG075_17310 [Alphaproteobacteria bacterium]|nr:hypothetical protein [Alphaproteobacteria bacterium]
MPAFDVPANLAFDNYGELIAGINDWLDRSDLTGSAPTMIALAESRLRRELAPFFVEKSASISVTAGVGAFPDDFGTLTLVSCDGKPLVQVSPFAALDIPASSVASAYTIEASGIRVWPAGDFTVTLLYKPALPQLTETTPTASLLSAHPDLYFFGAMMFAEGYVANDPRASLFKGLWDEAIAEAKVYLTRQSFGGPLVPRLGFVP